MSGTFIFKVVALVVSLAVLVFLFLFSANIENRFNQKYGYHWSMADKSSTISAKNDHISRYLAALKEGYAKGEFSSHDAIFFKNPDNSFEYNLNALETLSVRLGQIENMKMDSFEYTTAIQQITGQEQGEAGAMISVFSGCYALSVAPITWGWIGASIFIITLLILLSFGFTIVVNMIDGDFE